MNLSSAMIKISLSILVFFSLYTGLDASVKTNKMARKHYVLGDKFYDQRRMNDAINEWKIAIKLDPKLEENLSKRINKAEYFTKHGKLMEDRNDAEVAEDPSAPKDLIIKPKSKRAMEQIKAEILQIERVGGRVAKIMIGAGSQNKLRPGYDGFVAEPNGSPVAILKILAVDQEQSLAEVTSLSRDISDDAVAIINRPKK